MVVAGICSTGTYPSSLGFVTAGPRSGGGDGKLSYSTVSNMRGFEGMSHSPLQSAGVSIG